MSNTKKTAYKISNPNGLQGRAWRETYSDLPSAVEAVRAAYGWKEAFESEWYTDDDGQAVSLYSSQEACNSDDTGADAPRVSETEVDE